MTGRSLRRSSRDLFLVWVLAAVGGTMSCKYIPGDSGWPNASDWAQLNDTVGGRLIMTTPLASVCHTSPYSDYSETACENLAARWTMGQTIATQPAEFMNPYFQNQSCDPFTPASQPCELGNYAVYSINVTGADDVIAGVQFAQKRNIRLVVKTTGHDFMGRSTGQGALALWMWNLKSADPILEYASEGYSGPAIKLGSGVMAGEAYEAASEAGYRVVGGECGSVGIAAGYTQGGGHSMLSTAYGMGADQVLEWEVVTAQGEHLVATPERNADLYWALSGGGGGTYAVALSMTAKMHPDGVVSGGTLAFANTNNTAYWEAISLWIQQAPAFIGDKNTIIYVVLNEGFQATAITLPDQPASAVNALLAPFLSDLTRLNITYSLKTTEFDSYLGHFNNYYGPLPYGTQSLLTTIQSRMVPLAVTQSANATARLVDALQLIAADGSFLVGCAVVSVANASHPDNAVLPAWRDAVTGCNVISEWNFTAPLETNLDAKRRLVQVYAPALEAATPGGGVYLNEMDPWYQGDWKTTLFGTNYDRLLDIKHTHDPSHIFWGNFTVGSDESFLDGSGRLCQA